MKCFNTIFFVLCLGFFYSQNDSLQIKTWNQLSLIPDSNNYHLFFGGPSSIYRSLYFKNNDLPILNNNPMFLKEQTDMPLIKLDLPVVDVQYIIGDEQEQNLAIYHNQPISENSNYALSFLKRSHDGYYTNQSTNANFFQAHYFYGTSKYKIFAGLKHHRIFNEQNGGLVNDSSFSNTDWIFLNRLLLDVKMNNAFSNDKLWKFFFNQSYQIKSSSDSVSKKTNFIDCNINYNSKFRNYYDSLETNNFLYNYLDTLVSNDSIQKDILSSELKYRYEKVNDSIQTIFKIGWQSDFISHSNLSIDTLINNQALFTNYSKISKNNSFQFKGKYFPIGFKRNNYEINLNGSKKLSKKIKIFSELRFENNRPVFELNNFSSNHQEWNYSHDNALVFSALGKLDIGQFSYSINYSEIKNPIYFDYVSHPVQFDGSAQVIQSKADYEFVSSKIYFLSEIIYQYQGGAQIFKLPEWIGQLKFNYSVRHKKSNFRLILGVNGRFYSSFELMGYSPTLNQFNISDQKLQSSYFVTDFIAKTMIKNVTVYAMVAHFNAGLMGANYFTALNYPSPDRYIKFGLKWLFLN